MSAESIHGQELYVRIQSELGRSQHHFYGMNLAEVEQEMPDAQRIGIYDGRTVEVAVVDPDSGEDRDEQDDLVLAEPYLNGWTPHHYIRAKALQHIVAPNSRVIVLPNSSFGHQSYSFTDTEQQKLKHGDIAPLSEQQMKALERLDIKTAWLTGYSQGATNVLGIASIGSDKIDVAKVNADEVPSETGRDAKALQKAFMESGGLGALRAAVRDACINALAEAMSPRRLAVDLTKFGLVSQRGWAKDMAQTMTGSAEGLVQGAIRQLGKHAVKVGFIEGSSLFDPSSLSPETEQAIRLVHYKGNLMHGHASGDNVYMHAAMVRDGLVEHE